jgi:hypothetical protein
MEPAINTAQWFLSLFGCSTFKMPSEKLNVTDAKYKSRQGKIIFK